MAGRNEDRKHINRMEALVNSYEQKNQELEEKELEVRYRLQMLENTMPALMMWNLWRMMMFHTSGSPPTSSMQPPPGLTVPSSVSQTEGLLPLNREEELMAKLKSLEGKLNTETRLLEDSKFTEEQLREKVKELEQSLVSRDNNILEILNRDPAEDQEVFEKLSKMAKDRVDMDRRIKDLELKEKLYQETLQQADAMFAQMETNFSKQMKEKEDIIIDHEERLADSEGRLKQAMKSSAVSNKLEEKIAKLEHEIKILKESLIKKDQDKEKLDKEEKKLKKELEEAVEELENIKETVEGPLMTQVEVQKKKTAALERELSELEELRTREEDLHRIESAVFEVRSTLAQTQTEKEELRELFEAKLEEKERQLEELKTMSSPILEMTNPKSLKEELDDIIVLQKHAGETILPEIHTPKGDYRLIKIEEVKNIVPENLNTVRMELLADHCEDWMTAQIKEPPNSPPPPPPSGEEPPEISIDTNWSDMDTASFLTAVYTVGDVKYNNVNLLEIPKQNFIGVQSNIIHAPLENEEKREIIQEDLPLLVTNLPPDCNIAQDAVTKSSGKNLPKAMDNLNKAFQHSKNCKKCNETLGGFLSELIQSLGVKLPRVKGLDADREPEYAGQPSTLTTTKPGGPGTVGYDPMDSPQGYRLKPTVSTLALNIEELRDKCRVKDHIIEMMADELRRLGAKTNWSGTDLLADISDQPTTDPTDYDRRALYQYLNKEPVHGLQTESEIEGTEEFPATNPLGLKVIRQVGPDSLLLKWAPPPANSQIYAFELFVNGMFLQRIRSPGRNKTLIHPVDLSSKITITLNALTYNGETSSAATVGYP